MKRENLSKATLGRLPIYLRYLRALSDDYISAAEMARVLNLGEVMVRKDLSRVCSQGRPKIGYPRRELVENLDELLGARDRVSVVLPIERMAGYCRENDVRVGVIAVPESAAQAVCDRLIEGGVTAVWNFAPYPLKTPKGVTVQNENLALSLAHLCLASGRGSGLE